MKTHARVGGRGTRHRRTARISAQVAAAVATLVALAGCSILGGAIGGPTWEETNTEARMLLDRVEDMLPADSVTSRSVNEVVVSCGSNAAQLDRIVTIGTLADFDRIAWLDEVAAEYESDDQWNVTKQVAADNSSDDTLGLALLRKDA